MTDHAHAHPAGGNAVAPGEMAKDPICGMMVKKAGAVAARLTSERGARMYYFCSSGCKSTFEDPERELKSMRTRVTVALTGVLALAMLRAGAFIALATGATIVSWAPIPALPWFTWGVWLFILVTPVQFIGGWGFYKGAWAALRSGSINMDFLIALGTSVAYFFSVAVVFFPDVLPVKVNEREVYFEVSAVIIAFVLLGKYMEEIIKKRSSAAVRKLMDLRPAVAHVVRDGKEEEVPALLSAATLLGIASKRAPPWNVFVPERVTAFATKPEARPNSAVMPPRLMLNSTMSNSFTSVFRLPKPGFVMLTPSSR